MKKVIVIVATVFALASCAHTQDDGDEAQGGGERVEAPASESGAPETA